jgi:hypothetical protein
MWMIFTKDKHFHVNLSHQVSKLTTVRKNVKDLLLSNPACVAVAKIVNFPTAL